ncbi:uncharacterized protein [Montipora foliosa]|uniref:uncharacterized protein n=1 Tax=Montipora foliosa TaxID=591990 RepID=UPI0035F1FF27
MLTLKTPDNEVIEPVENFKHLGSWISDSEHDFKVRKPSAWITCNKMRFKAQFRATVESGVLYGSEKWTVTKKLEKSVNGSYTRMRGMALKVHWQQPVTNQELYGSLPSVSETIRARRLRLAGHCACRNEKTALKVLLWESSHGFPNRGRPKFKYIDTIKADTGLDNTKEIKCPARSYGEILLGRLGMIPGLNK